VFFSVAESSVNLSTGRLAKSPKRLVFPKSIFRFRCFFSIYLPAAGRQARQVHAG
jgi:hypothetical protein